MTEYAGLMGKVLPFRKKEGPPTIDDVLAAEGKKHAPEIEEAFGHYDTFTDEDNVTKILMETLVPAHDKFYTTFTEHVRKLGDTSAKVHGKRKELETAVTAALKEYFKLVMPSAIEALKGIPEDEHYEILARMYDQHIGNEKTPIRALVEIAKGKHTKVGEVLQLAHRYRQEHPQTAYQNLRGRVIGHHFSKFHPHQVAGYLRERLPEYKLKVKDPTAFISQGLGDYLVLYEGIKTGRFPEGVSYERFGLERAKEKKEMKKAA